MDNNYEEILSDEKGLIRKISNLFEDKISSDLIIIVGTQEYYCHKFILSASSDVFARMLDQKWKTIDDKDTVTYRYLVLKESFEAEKIFPSFLRFLYTGEITVTIEGVIALTCLADKYNVESLRNLTLNYMYRNSRTPNIINALQWYSSAKTLNLNILQTHCWETICSNFQKMLLTEDILESLDINLWCEILESSTLIVESEYLIFEVCKKWLYRECNLSNVNQYAERIFSLIRFPLMSPVQLLEIENKELFEEFPDVKKLLRKKLILAHKYRSICSYIIGQFQSDWYNPRNYTHLIVDRLNTQKFTKSSNTIDKTAIKTPYFSNELMEWRLKYKKISETWTVTLRSNDKSAPTPNVMVQFVLIATNSRDEVLNVVHSKPNLYSPFMQDRIDIDVLGRENELRNILVLIKMLIC